MPNYGLLAQQGRREDNAAMGGQVAHISALEAELLRLLGGADTTNPMTGLPEYYFTGQTAAYSAGSPGVSYGGAAGPGGSIGGPGGPGPAPQAPTIVSPPPPPTSPPVPIAVPPLAPPTSLDGDTSIGNWEGAPTHSQVYLAQNFAPNSPLNTSNPFAAYNMGYSPYTVAPPSMTWGEAAAVLGPIAFSALTGGIPAAVFSLGTTVAQAIAKGGKLGQTAANVANAVAGITGAPQGGPSAPVSYAKTGASKGGIGSAVTGSISTPTLVQAIAEPPPEEEKEVAEGEPFDLGFPESPLLLAQRVSDAETLKTISPEYLAQFGPAIQDVLLQHVADQLLQRAQTQGQLA